MSVIDSAVMGIIERMECVERDRQWIKDNNAVIAAELRRLRLQKGLSLRGVAKELGISVQYLLDIELGNRSAFSNAERLTKWISIVTEVTP